MITPAKTKKSLLQPKIILGIGIIILFIVGYLIFQSFSEKQALTRRMTSVAPGGEQGLLMQVDDMLHARLLALQQMDREYASLLNNTESPLAIELTQLSIQEAEDALKNTLDSLEGERKSLDENTSSDLWKLTTYFKTIVENRWFLSKVKAAGRDTAFTSEEQLESIALLEKELRNKEELIAAFRSRLADATAQQSKEIKQQPGSKTRIRVVEQETGNTDEKAMEYKPAPGETIEELKQRNVNLKLAFNNTSTQMGLLTKKYNLLKKDYDRLSNQLRGSSQNR